MKTLRNALTALLAALLIMGALSASASSRSSIL